MNTKRYVAAGAISLLVHSMFLAAMPTKDPITLTMGTDTPRVSLTFVAIPPAVAQVPPSTVTPITPTVSVLPKKTVVSTMKRLEKTAIATKKTLAPPKKIAQPIKTPLDPVKKKRVISQKPMLQKSPSETPKTTKKVKTTLKPIKILSNQSNEIATSTIDNAGTQALKLVSKPTFAIRPGPVNYPKLAKRRGIEGQVLIEVWIDTNGQQLKQRLIKSSDAHILDNAAMAAIKKWHFSSHIVNGKAIAYRVQIPVRFKLD